MCSRLESNVGILVVNTVSTSRVMKSMEIVCMVVRWDFMVTNVSKVGFVKIKINYCVYINMPDACYILMKYTIMGRILRSYKNSNLQLN